MTSMRTIELPALLYTHTQVSQFDCYLSSPYIISPPFSRPARCVYAHANYVASGHTHLQIYYTCELHRVYIFFNICLPIFHESPNGNKYNFHFILFGFVGFIFMHTFMLLLLLILILYRICYTEFHVCEIGYIFKRLNKIYIKPV